MTVISVTPPDVLYSEYPGGWPVTRATHPAWRHLTPFLRSPRYVLRPVARRRPERVESFIREEGGQRWPPALVCSPSENDYATVNGMIMPRAKCGAPVSKSGMKQMAKWSPAVRSTSR